MTNRKATKTKTNGLMIGVRLIATSFERAPLIRSVN
jgi:hypothetical protein